VHHALHRSAAGASSGPGAGFAFHGIHNFIGKNDRIKPNQRTTGYLNALFLRRFRDKLCQPFSASAKMSLSVLRKSTVITTWLGMTLIRLV
jgi:hypothetical protein